VFARPGADPQSLRETLDELELGQKVVVLVDGKAEGASPVSELIRQSWDLGPVVRRYRTFLNRFQLLLSSIDQGAPLTGERAFVVQTLLIDSFRRITLHDPRLPLSLLPADWPGNTAYELCRHLYRRTYRLVRNHVLPRFTDDTSSAQVPAEILRRFGGL